MPTKVYRYQVRARQFARNAVPAARMESRGMEEEHDRTGARPLKQRHFQIAEVNPFLYRLISHAIGQRVS